MNIEAIKRRYRSPIQQVNVFNRLTDISTIPNIFLLGIVFIAFFCQYMSIPFTYRPFHGGDKIPDKNAFPMPKRRHQKVVILMASPGIAFSELEQELYHWDKETQLQPWSWAIPDIRPEVYNVQEGFKPLMESIHFHSTSPPRGHEEFDRASKNQSDFFLEQFSQGFLFEWVKNKNILISSDHFHLWKDNVKSVRKLLSLLPWHDRRYSLYGSNMDVKVVVLQPMDKLKHINHVFQLFSSSSLSSQPSSISEWLATLDDLSSFDTLSLAQRFQDEGIKVDVLAFDNHNANNLKRLVACHILGISICQNGSISNDQVEVKHYSNHTSFPDYKRFLSLWTEYECSFDFVTSCTSNLTTSDAKANLLEYIQNLQK